MAKPKSVTINLTAKQRAQLRSITGVDHKEIKIEAKGPLSTKTAPRQSFLIGPAGGQGGLRGVAVLASKSAPTAKLRATRPVVAQVSPVRKAGL